MEGMLIINQIINLILLLYGETHLPRKIVNDVVEFMHDFLCRCFMPSLKKDLLKAIDSSETKEQMKIQIEAACRDHSRVFGDVLTESNRMGHLKSRGYIEPKEFIMGYEKIEHIIDNKLILSKKVVKGE